MRDENGEAPNDAFLATPVKQTKQTADDARALAPSPECGRSTTKKERLTRRQREVLDLATQGCSNAEIAAKLGISPVTVSKTLSAAYLKLKARNRAEAARRFMEQER